jgi:hypothetical protein
LYLKLLVFYLYQEEEQEYLMNAYLDEDVEMIDAKDSDEEEESEEGIL